MPLTTEQSLKKLVESLSHVQGLSNITAVVTAKANTGCRLTRDGAVVTINPDDVENLARRAWYGARGVLSKQVAAYITVAHQIGIARDFTDPSFSLEREANPRQPDYARRFFNKSVDDIAVDLRLRKIPFIARHYQAYISRLIPHVMDHAPFHVQTMNALKLYLLEDDPLLYMSPEIVEALGNASAHDPAVDELYQALNTSGLTYEERHRAADEILFPLFRRMYDLDVLYNSSFIFTKTYAEFNFFGESDNPEQSEFSEAGHPALQQRVDALIKIVSEQNIERMIKDRNEDVEPEQEGNEGAPSLSLPRSTSEADEIDLAEDESQSYLRALSRWMDTVNAVSSVLAKLSNPHESIAVPRYRKKRAFEGARLNPAALPDTTIQLETGTPRPIWQPIEKRVRHQDLQFNGLDIFLLLDVSGSMRGENAEYAAATSLCLIEGLQLARHRAELDAAQGNVDVRVQLLAFGSGWAELTPLTREPTYRQKQLAYFNLLNPDSNHTMVNGALKKVSNHAREDRVRKVLCLVISDGLFADNLTAFKTVRDMPGNTYVGHVNIGDFAGIPITRNYDAISDPRVLPSKLKGILQGYSETFNASL